MAVVKANAYGHGLLPTAKVLYRADAFAVARLTEALALRKAAIAQRILVLGTLLTADELLACAAFQLDVVVHDKVSFDAVVNLRGSSALNVWLKLDAGMNRVGLRSPRFFEADRILRAHPCVKQVMHMTHFSCADDLTSDAPQEQLKRFIACREQCEVAPASAANSAALLLYPQSHMDWVRPGILLYGGQAHVGQQVPVRPAMSLRAHVIAVRDLEPGAQVGYHGRWVSQSAARIATVGAGYGDGYPRNAPDGVPIFIKGQLCRLAGRVSMDSLTVDVTDCVDVAVGDQVELWGTHIRATDVATAAGTIDYDLFASLPERAHRIYSS